MRMLAAIAVSLLLTAVVYGWGSGDGVREAVSSLQEAQRTQGDAVLVVQEGVYLNVSSFRRVLGAPFDARRYGLAGLELAAEVAEASGAEGIGAAGGVTDAGRGLPAGYQGRSESAPRGQNNALGGREEGVGAVDACPPAEFKLAALNAYGVGQHFDKMLRVEFCESSCQTTPCKMGLAGERGSLQFLPSTWVSADGEGNHWNPYWQEDACDPIVAWHAAGAFIAAGRIGEWSCFWLTP